MKSPKNQVSNSKSNQSKFSLIAMLNPVDKAMLMQYATAVLIIIAIIAAIALIYHLFFNRKSTKSFALSPQQLQQIPIFLHSGRAPASSAVGGGGGATSCAICLEEYGRGEECRRMPQCGHWFHAECVEQWLLKSGTCPACRALVAV